MDLGIDEIVKKLEKNDIVGNFIKELEKSFKREDTKKHLSDEEIENIQLTPEEELEFDRKEYQFLQDFFSKKLSKLSEGEIYIVTNKYENDDEYHRYKVTQYKNNLECKYIAFEKDLPENIKIGDVVRKVNGTYIYEEDATRLIKEAIRGLKEEIINNRKG